MVSQTQWTFVIMAVLCGTTAFLLARARGRAAAQLSRISWFHSEPSVYEVVLVIVAASAGLLSLVALLLLVMNRPSRSVATHQLPSLPDVGGRRPIIAVEAGRSCARLLAEHTADKLPANLPFRWRAAVVRSEDVARAEAATGSRLLGRLAPS